MDAVEAGRTRHGFDVMAEALRERTSSPIFGLLGDGNLAAIARAVELGMTFVPSRHESGALGMATGHAMSTGLTTVATTTRGPGFANAMVGLVSATRDRAPLVFFAGESGLAAAPAAQSLDQEAMTAPTGARFLRVTAAGELRATTDLAFELASAERRPVVLSVPTNLLHGPAADQVTRGSARAAQSSGLMAAAPGTSADPGLLRLAWERLCVAERPVILTGRGTVQSGARDLVARLAEASGALLVSSLPVNGLFLGDPFDLGLCGGFALARTRALLDDADVVLVLGASLNRYTLAEGSLLTESFVIQVDVDDAAFGRTRKADLAILGDVGEAASAMLALAADAPRVGLGYRTDAVATHISATNFALDIAERYDLEGVDPRGVLRALDRGLPSTRRIVVDVGHFSAFPCQVMPTSYPGQLLPAFGFGAVGMGISTALGVSIAHPEDPVVVVVGDGGVLMSMGELETVARVGGRLIIVVMNDAAYSAEVHHLRHHGLPTDTARFPRVDFAAIARALGIHAISISTQGDLERLAPVGALAGPVVVDVRVHPGVVSDRFLEHPRVTTARA